MLKFDNQHLQKSCPSRERGGEGEREGEIEIEIDR